MTVNHDHARRRRRNGMALLMALLAIVLMAALVTATIVRADADAHVSQAATLRQRALTAGESALWRTVASANAAVWRAAPIGTSATSASVAAGVSTVVTVTKVDTTLYWLVADANAPFGGDFGHHRLGLSVRLDRDTADQTFHPIPGRAWVELF